MKSKRATALVLALIGLSAGADAADLSDVDEIVRRANLAAYYAGDDGRSDARMRITDSQGREQLRQFIILRRSREDGGDQDFMVFFSRPADVRGMVFQVAKHLDRDDDRWLYLPGLDLVKRISAGDKRTSFVGSHFFYEDVSGRNPNADRHVLKDSDAQYYVLENTPVDARAAEFENYTLWVDKQTFLPMKIEYTNEVGEIYRRIEVLEVDVIQGHPTVVRSRADDLQGGGHTLLEFRYISYDLGLPEDVFSERSLRNPPRQWLKRPST
jgi:hypothetical protein